MSEQNKIDALAAEVEFWKQAAETQKENNLVLIKKIERKDEALRFYADEENHEWSHTYDEAGEVEEIPSKVSKDLGKRAREAL